MTGTRVEYRGSLDDFYGYRFVVAEEVRTDTGLRYDLATYAGEIVLRNVRPSSVTPVPEGPKHRVVSAVLRAQIAQAEFARQYPPGTRMPDIQEHFDKLDSFIANLIRQNRPVEAEYWLLQAEQSTGAISYEHLQAGVDALVIAGDDESWMPRAMCRATQTAA